MVLAAENLKDHDLKAVRLGLDRARKIYVEGIKLQHRARRGREEELDDSETISEPSPNTALPGRNHNTSAVELMHVNLPAEWHNMQAQVEADGAEGLARAKTHWLQLSTKIQVIHGCMDFLNLSKLITNIKLDKKMSEGFESDDEIMNHGKDISLPVYLNVDHSGMLERLRKSIALSQSRVLQSMLNLDQLQLEVIDFCKVRLLSAGETMFKAGDELTYFVIILRGSLRLEISRLEASRSQGTEQVEKTPKPVHQSSWSVPRRKSNVFSSRQSEEKSNFAFGHVETVPDDDSALLQGTILSGSNTEALHPANCLGLFVAWRVVAESHLVLQRPFYANVVAMQDETEVLEFHVPPPLLHNLRSFYLKSDESTAPIAQVHYANVSAESMREIATAEQQSQAAKVRCDVTDVVACFLLTLLVGHPSCTYRS